MGGIVICIDGLSATGKGTLARNLANIFGFELLDSGALYRSISLIGEDAKLAAYDTAGHLEVLNALKFDVRFQPLQDRTLVYLQGRDRTDEIRSETCARRAAIIAKEKPIRQFLIPFQKQFAELGKGLVADGRDMGTVIFPKAEVKFYLKASNEVRLNRRLEDPAMVTQNHKNSPSSSSSPASSSGRETKPSTNEKIDKIQPPRNSAAVTASESSEIAKLMNQRDADDSNRKISRAVAATDATVVDTTHLNRDEVLAIALEYIREKLPDLKAV